MRYWLLALILSGALLPLACSPFPAASPVGSRFFQTPTSTPTNLNGWTSTPTATFQPTLAFIGTFNTSAPNGVAYANNDIYVAEGASGVSQVQVFSSSSTSSPAWTWTTYNGTANFKYPNGIAVNSTSSPTTVYVLDAGNSANSGAIYAMAPTATPTLLGSWASYNGTTLNEPNGIALDTSGNVYVADTGNRKLEEFSPTGGSLASWSSSGYDPVAVALDSANHIYVADGEGRRVAVLTLSGGTFTQTTGWSLPSNGHSSNNGPSYYGITVDGASPANIFVADFYKGQVEVYSNAGQEIGSFTGNENSGTQLAGPDAILFYNNDLYVGNYDSNSNTSNYAGIVEIFGPDTY